jgi:TetR/AcrR family transcriptional regulator, cholesterol catabolism regulator
MASQSSPASLPGIRSEIAILKRERTISAAVKLFYLNGDENTTLDAVAEQLGVTKPFIYAHYTSKAELLAEICTRGIAASLKAIDSVRGLDCSQTEKLAQFGARFVMAVLENQMYIGIFAREEKNLRPEDFLAISSMRRDFDHKLAALLQEGVTAGEFHIRDPRLAALAIGGLVSWSYVWYRPGSRLSLDKIASEISDLILAMVGVEPKRPKPPAKRPSRNKTKK